MNLPARAGRRRRRYTAEFKAEVVAACMRPGVSIAAVALAHQLNANLLRRWVQEARDQDGGQRHDDSRTDRGVPSMVTVPTLVPVTLQVPETEALVATETEIRVEVRRPQGTVQVTWPASQAAICAQWLRDLLR